MRIIAGVARGRGLVAPPGREVRPTLDRVREALFSILTPRVAGARFLDLYAGSGANGLEAMSRGASRVVLVDSDRRSLAAIRDNVARTGLSGDLRSVQATLPEGLEQVGGPFDIVFADPPYAYEHYEALLNALSSASLLDAEGIVCIEHDRHTLLPETCGGLHRARERRWGATAVSFYGWANLSA